MPKTVRHIVFGASLLLLVASWVCVLRWPAAALPLLLTGAWMVGNMVFLSALVTLVIRPKETLNVGAAFVMASVKMGWLVGGLVAFFVMAPYTRLQLAGVLAGVSIVILTIFLKAVGSLLTGQPLFARANAVSEPSLNGKNL